MKTPDERLNEALDSFSPEDLARLDRELNDPGREPEPVDWLDDPDPLGRGWDWVDVPPDQRGGIVHPRNAASETGVFSWQLRRSTLIWVSGLAASLLVVAIGLWSVTGRKGSIAERTVAAWVGERIDTTGGGVRIAAPAGGDEQATQPLVRNFDLPRDADLPQNPNVYAPLRIQEQLTIPEIPEGSVPDPSRLPVRTLVDSALPGSLFYLSFSTSSAQSPGSAVVVATRGGSFKLLWEEVSVLPREGTGYFGPIRMGESASSYFVIVADRTATPLLTTVANLIAKGDARDGNAEALKRVVSAALQDAGHRWFGVQKIDVRPETGVSKAR